MIYVSFVEIFPKAVEALSSQYSSDTSYLITTILFFVGMGLIAFIDYLIPTQANPHEFVDDKEAQSQHLMRLGLFSALAIALHNFPEGLATFIATLQDPRLGISIAVAIAIHNVPEGIAVATPIYHATKSKKKAIVGYLLLRPFLSDSLFGVLFALIAGIMVYISLDELLPTAEKFGKHHLSIIGLIIGMLIMATSLLLF